MAIQSVQRSFSTGRHGNRKASTLQDPLDRLANLQLIVDDQNGCHVS
jgi:hypothetical protein